MAVGFVRCRNTKTDAETDIPETALPHFTDWEPVDPDTRAEAGAETEPTSDETTASKTTSKGRPAAKNTKE